MLDSKTQSPRTCGAVARRQLHEIAVHTYDAQVTAGAPQPLPDEVALDGAEEFLSTFCTTTVAWPHEPAVVGYHAAEGRYWRHRLAADGARAMTWSWPSTAGFRWTPAHSRATGGSSTSSWTGTRSGRSRPAKVPVRCRAAAGPST